MLTLFKFPCIVQICAWFFMQCRNRHGYNHPCYKISHSRNECEALIHLLTSINTLRPKQNGRHFADDLFKCIFLNEDVWIPTKNSLTFVPEGPINNIPTLVQIMAWRHSGDKPLSESMLVSSPTHICVTRPQWVKKHWHLPHENWNQDLRHLQSSW